MYKTLGMVLIALGLVGLVWGGFTYTTREKVADIGSIDITQNETRSLPPPPLLGAVAFLGGIVRVVSGKKGLASTS